MQGARWLTFGMAGSLTRTAIHFFPSGGNVSAPYPVVCKLTLFSAEKEPRTITVDGLRLSTPEGIWIDEAFSGIKEGAAPIFGLELCLNCTQQRVDLHESSCIVELASMSQSARFWPAACPETGFSANDPARQIANNQTPVLLNVLAIKDAFHISSIIAVNYGATAAKANFSLWKQGSSERETLPAGKDLEIAPHAVREFDLETLAPEGVYSGAKAHECGWGLFRARSLSIETAETDSLRWYTVYRDAVTRRPVSVSAL